MALGLALALIDTIVMFALQFMILTKLKKRSAEYCAMSVRKA